MSRKYSLYMTGILVLLLLAGLVSLQSTEAALMGGAHNNARPLRGCCWHKTLTVHVEDTSGGSLKGAKTPSGDKPLLVGGSQADDDDTFTYCWGTWVTIEANKYIIKDGKLYEFDHWDGAGIGCGMKRYVYMSSDKTVTAVYKQIPQKQLKLHVNPSGQGAKNFKVRIKWSPFGTYWYYVDTVDSGTYTHKFPKGAYVKLTAINSSRFDKWEGSITSTNTQITFRMCSDKEIYAYFLWKITATSSTGGSVSLTGYRKKVGSSYYYRDGASGSATATPNSGYWFDHWEIDCCSASSSTSTDNPLNGAPIYPVHGDHSLKAIFWEVHNFNLQVKDKDTSSSISCKVKLDFTPPSGAENAPDPTTKGYSNGWSKTLYKGTEIKATPKSCSGYRFDHFDLSGASWSGSNSFKIDGSDVTLTAYYVKTYKLTTYITDGSTHLTGKKAITLDPKDNNNKNRGKDGSKFTYDYGTSVTLTADSEIVVNGVHYTFDHWADACSGSSCSVTMDSDKTVTAVYKVVTHTLTTYVTDGTSHLSGVTPLPITLSPADSDGHSSGGDGDTFTYNYDENNPVALAAASEIVVNGVHYTFDHWADACSGSSCSVTMDSDKTVTAVYKVVTHTLTVQVRDPDNHALSCKVNVNPPDSDVSDGWSNTYTYDENNPVTLTANSCPGYRFDHWEYGSNPTTNSITVMMSSDKTVTAVYIKQVKITHISVVDDEGNDMGIKPTFTFIAPTSGTTYSIKNPSAPNNGQYDDSDCPLTMDVGTTIAASVPSQSGYNFDHWEIGSSIYTTNNIIHQITSDEEFKVVYWKWVKLSLDIEDDQSNSLGANLYLTFTKPADAKQSSGIVPSDGNYGNSNSPLQMYRGTQISATANPYTGYQFDHWTSSCSAGSCSFTMSDDKTLGAVYWKLIDLSVDVKDELGASIGCAVHLDFTAPSGASNSPPEPDGNYVGGSTITNLYRGTDVTPSSLTCSGYRFDHWEVDGSRLSGSSFAMSDDRTIAGIYWKQYTLTVEVEGSGTVSPYGVGTHAIDRGTLVHLSPVPYADYSFDYWTADGTDIPSSSGSTTISILMSADHHVIAHFVSSPFTPATPTIPVAAPVYKGCILPTGFPTNMKYRAMYEDLMFNRDLFRRTKGPASASDNKNIFVLGGPNAIPYPWQDYHVYFEEGALRVENVTYEAEYGHKDYAAILLDCNNTIVRIAGVNRYGTRAGFMWVLNHPDKVDGKLLIVVEWIDSNGNGKVEDKEISVIYSLP